DGVEIVGIRAFKLLFGLEPAPLAYSSDVVEAINFARHNKIDIINLSIGIRDSFLNLSPYRNLGNNCGGFGDDEMAEYQALQDYGGLALVAAGNDDVESGGADNRVFIPGDYSATVHINGEKCWDGLDNVISVGGTQLDSESGKEEVLQLHEGYSFRVKIIDDRLGGGNENDFVGTTWGNHITVAAPARGIPISDASGTGSCTGTSCATAQVTGVAALMLRVNPDLTPGQIKQKIKDSADIVTDLYDTNVANGRRLNAYRAVKAALPDSTSIPPQLDPLPKIKINENEDPLESFIDYVGTAYKKG
ncbi:MAG: S8/S53 family peptidase, partial [Nitrosopumilaceae archaeon]|nr:S8/S53 family peptidase [Nitrosopumilaceae archaeon]